MKAITDFTATRAHILHAVSVFAAGLAERQLQETLNRNAWVDTKHSKDLFRRSKEYWQKRSKGEIGDTFDRYAMQYAFRIENQGWYENKLERAEELLKKFDCAVINCEAKTIYLSDSDLELLSISLQSALKA